MFTRNWPLHVEKPGERTTPISGYARARHVSCRPVIDADCAKLSVNSWHFVVGFESWFADTTLQVAALSWIAGLGRLVVLNLQSSFEVGDAVSGVVRFAKSHGLGLMRLSLPPHTRGSQACQDGDKAQPTLSFLG